MIKTPMILAAGLTLAALAGCVDDDFDDGSALRSGSGSAEQACIAAVNTNFGRSVATVTSSEFSEANTIVMLSAEGETWRCLTSDNGTVEEVSVVG